MTTSLLARRSCWKGRTLQTETDELASRGGARARHATAKRPRQNATSFPIQSSWQPGQMKSRQPRLAFGLLRAGCMSKKVDWLQCGRLAGPCMASVPVLLWGCSGAAPAPVDSRGDCRGVEISSDSAYVAPGLCLRAVANRQGPLRQLMLTPSGDLL